MSLFKQNIAIDLGTATVLVSVGDKGVVIKEPSIVAVKEGTSEVIAIGEEARLMMGRTPFDITTVRPVQNGVISSYTITRKMIEYYLNKAITNPFARKFKPDVLVCIPSNTTNVEKRAVYQASISAGAGRVFLVEEPLAAAVGAGLDISRPTGNMIIDVGGGTTDIAVISVGGVVVSSTIKVAGDSFDQAIISYIRKTHGLFISEDAAETIKVRIGTAIEEVNPQVMEVKGRNVLTGLPKKIKLTSEEIREALKDATGQIVEAVHGILEKTPPELVADIVDRGIVLAGGGALLKGMDT